MHVDGFTQWVFTALFSVLALVSLVWLVIDRGRPLLAVSNLLHLAMSVAMVAMVWATPSVGLAWTQIVVFAGGAVWFCVLAWLRAARRVTRRSVGGHGPWHLLGHAVMMLAMVWMVAAMGTSEAEPASHQHGALSAGLALFGTAAAAGLVVAGVLLIVALVDCLRSSLRVRRHTGDLAGGAVMSLGMAAMCWSMLG